MQRKGSYFFVIDAFIGSIIIISAFLITTTQYSAKPSSAASYYTAQDFLNVLDTTQIRDYGYPGNAIQGMVSDGTIADTQISLLNQIALFYQNGNYANASLMAKELLNNIPNGISIELNINTGSNILQLANKTITDKKDAVVVFSAQRMVVLKKSATELYPPTVIEVRTWQ